MAIRNDYEIAEKSSSRELYRFYIGDGSMLDYRYTNRDDDYVDPADASNTPYKSIPISRGKIKHTSSTISAPVTIEVPRDSEIAERYKSEPPNGVINIDISVAFDESYGQITDRENLIIWKGRVSDVKFSGNKAVLTCKSAYEVLDRLALRRRATIHCPYALFSINECKVHKESARRVGVVTSVVSQTTVTVEEDHNGGLFGAVNLSSVYDYANHYNGGFAKYIDVVTGQEHRVGITSMSYDGAISGTKSNVTINFERPASGIVSGMVLDLYPGCARNTKHCYFKFSNYKNFGGIPHLSTDDPFTSAFRTPLN